MSVLTGDQHGQAQARGRTGPSGVSAQSVTATLKLIVKLAARELRSGLSGFRILIACIALGVAVITAVGALADALLDGFAREGRVLLGGDIALNRIHQRASEAERARMAEFGRVGEVAVLRSMARVVDGDDQSLVEIKGVDNAYPLIGAVELKSERALDAVLSGPNAIVAAQSLLDRLQLSVGDTVRIGGTPMTIADVLVSEPDKLAARLPFGPRVMMSVDTLLATGLVAPGTLINWRYAIALPNGADAAATGRSAFTASMAEAGFQLRDRSNPSPQVTRALNRLRQFLVLLGLTALLVGGVGVANAVSTFVDRRQKVIATYKSVGGTAGVVFGVLLAQILAISAIGIAIGLVAGAAMPALVALFYGDALPVSISAWSGVSSLWVGAGYGLLIALLFAVWPLGQSERIRPAGLFRDGVAQQATMPGRLALVLSAIIAVLLVAFTVIATGTPELSLGFLGGVVVVLALFWALGVGVTLAARRLPRPGRPELALAMTGIAAPGGLTRSVILSLGAGLSLLIAVALVDRALVSELSGRLPANSPDYFALDITKQDLPAFKEAALRGAPDAVVETAPMLRGRIVSVAGTAASEISATGDGAWVLRGDRGLSFSETVPKGSRVVAGSWWPADYSGTPQVSVVADVARDLDLTIGDTLTVNVLGRNITAEIANLREIDWESLAINFVMVFSPNTLAAAPYNLLATVRLPKASGAEAEAGTAAPADAAVGREIGRALPAVTLVRVKDAIEAFSGIFANIMTAVRAAGGLTLLAGALVLAGALATAQRRRIMQAVILKCIGATRRKLLLAHALEYGMLALIAALLSSVIGVAAG
ncbi:MAG: FtsX-like permease family protein, partial [Pseudomonadota bacterium]